MKPYTTHRPYIVGFSVRASLDVRYRSGAEPQRGPGAVVRGLGGKAPLKLNAFLHYHNLRSWPICLDICFIEQKIVRRLVAVWDVWGHGDAFKVRQ